MTSLLSIDKLKEKLEEKYFSSDWVTKYSDINVSEGKSLLINTLSQVSIDLFDFFTLYLLSGEYCNSNWNIWQEQNKYLKVFLENKAEELEFVDERHINLNYEAQDYFLTNIIKSYDEIIIPSFSYLFKDLDTQFSINKLKTTFRVEKKANFDKYHKSITSYFQLFRWTILVTNLEHFKYSYSQKTLADLILIDRELDDLLIENNSIKALKCKIAFLLKKAVYRIDSHKKKEEISYSFDHNEDRSLSVSTTDLDESLKDWDTIIQIHYGFTTDYKGDQRKRAQEIYDSGSMKSYIDFHALVKIYKDDERSIEQVKNLINVFDEFPHQNSTLFNKYAKTITRNYLFNNEISLRIEEEDIESKDFTQNFKDYFLKIKNFQNQSFVKNYFPWEKLCEELSKKIDYLSDDLLDQKKFETFGALCQIFSNALEKFEEAFDWSKRKNLLPFQLCFAECKSKHEIVSNDFGNVNLFFISSFVIPIDYSLERKKLQDLQLKKIKFETLSTTYSKLKVVVKEVNETSDRLRNTERRSIEVLAIFSAISLFSIGSIQILTNNTVSNDPMLFYKIVMSFGYCLILFVLVIWIITRNNIKDVSWIHWCLIAILIVTSGIVIGSFIKNDMKKINPIVNTPN